MLHCQIGCWVGCMLHMHLVQPSTNGLSAVYVTAFMLHQQPLPPCCNERPRHAPATAPHCDAACAPTVHCLR